jgi:hypothetical protein
MKIKHKSSPCSRTTLLRLIAKFENFGTVHDQPRSGRSLIGKTKVEQVKNTLESLKHRSAFGECSTREISKQTALSSSTVWRIMRNQLNLYPYKLKWVHELKPDDYLQRQTFAEYCISEMNDDSNWLNKILWTDEAHFYLHGNVNTRDCIIWAEERPNTVLSRPLHDEKVTVWCGLTSEFILGPYFFEDVDCHGRHTVTVTGARYAKMITEYLVPELISRQCLEKVIFQQDGAPPHTCTQVKGLLKNYFKNQVISHGFPVQWPSRSPDFNPLDYWLWGYLKSKVYRNNVCDLASLRNAIMSNVLGITREQLHSGVSNFIGRMATAIEANGGYVELTR